MGAVDDLKYQKCKECGNNLPITAFKSAFNVCDNCISSGNITRRVRYRVPIYKKVYTVYQYRRNIYSKIFKQIQALALKYDHNIFYRTSPYKVLNLCYKRDKQGRLQHLGDEKHIFRYLALESVLCLIADTLLMNYELLPRSDVLNYLFKRTHLVFYTDEEQSQAELLETIRKPINVRLKAHIKLLRCLQKGMDIEEAVRVSREHTTMPAWNSNLKAIKQQ